MNTIPQHLIDEIVKDKKIRTAVARKSHRYFFAIYLSHYITFPFAPFHDEIFDITEREDNQDAVITAFRGSGKSTIMTLSYPLWSIIGRQQKKFVLILGHSMHQAQTYMKNIKTEMETNERLRQDLGPFKEENDWQSSSVVIPKYEARITCASYEQGIRGLRHRQYRPDLVICDDIEDLDSVKTLESRDKAYDWFKGEVIPVGDINTRVVVVGNLLHDDSLIMRLKREIREKQYDAAYRAYPFIDRHGNTAWPGKFPDQASVDKERRKINDVAAWQREYMLTIIPDTDRIIQKEWIKYYDDLPDKDPELTFRCAATGIDPAVSEKDTADFTAMVSAKAYARKDEIRVYILPYPVNERLSFLKSMQRAKEISEKLGQERKALLYVEEVSYQKSFIDMLKGDGYPAEGVPTLGADKRSRLLAVSQYLEKGQVYFPRHGAETLISQLLGFGAERHDDLVDAFTIIVGELFKNARPPTPWPDFGNDDDDEDSRPIFYGILERQF